MRLNASQPGRQNGFSLPLAIFVIVVMALIGTSMLNLSRQGLEALGSEVQSLRAFYAAESGAQIAMAQLFPLDGSPANCINPYPTSNFSAAGLDGCSALVQCTAQSTGGKTYYTLSSTGSCSLGQAYAERRIEVMASAP